MDKLTEYLKKLFNKKGAPTVLIFTGIIGILLIAFSGETEKKPVGETEETAVFSIDGSYEKELERRLEDTLSDIQGVGDVKVMITLSSTEEYVYAEETDISRDRQQTEYVIAGKGGIVTKVKSPTVTGAVIVCEGGGDSKVREKVYEAVSVSLGLSASHICVVRMK